MGGSQVSEQPTGEIAADDGVDDLSNVSFIRKKDHERGLGFRKADDPVLTQYFAEMAAYPLLDQAQEIALVRRYKSSFMRYMSLLHTDEYARERLGSPNDLSPSECATVGSAKGLFWGDPLIAAVRERLRRSGKSGERELGRKLAVARSQFETPRDGLFCANLRLVPYLIKDQGLYGLPKLDLIQEGNIGLMEAVRRFELDKGVKFPTYARWWVRNKILKAAVDKGQIIRISAPQDAFIRKVLKAEKKLREELARSPTVDEIARRVKKKAGDVAEALERSKLLKLGSIEGDSGRADGRGVIHTVEDTSSVSPVDSFLKGELATSVRRTLKRLTARQREVIQLRFGLTGEDPKALKEIGKALGISVEGVRQLECKAFDRLRRQSEDGHPLATFKDLLKS